MTYIPYFKEHLMFYISSSDSHKSIEEVNQSVFAMLY